MVTFNDCKKYWLPDKLIELLPSIYRNMDLIDPLKKMDVGFGEEGQLERFLHVFENELDKAQCYIEHILDMIDIDKTPCEILPYIAALVGLEPNLDLDCDEQRREIRDAVNVYRKKGTIKGLQQLARTFTDFNVYVVEFYNNILILNKFDNTILKEDQIHYLNDITKDTSHRIYDPDGYYRRNVIGLVLETDDCNAGFKNTNLNKLQRLLDFYVPSGIVSFIIIIRKCSRELDISANAESRHEISIKHLNQIGPYYARWWLENNVSWKTTNSEYIVVGQGPYINRWTQLNMVADTTYESSGLLVPGSSNGTHSGFVSINPFYSGYYYYSGGWHGEFNEYDENSGLWITKKTYDEEVKRIHNIDNTLYILTDYNTATTDTSEKYVPPATYTPINGDIYTSGSYGANNFMHKFDDGTYYLTARPGGRRLYSSNSDTGPWTYEGYLDYNHNYYDGDPVAFNSLNYIFNGAYNHVSRFEHPAKTRSMASDSLGQYFEKVVNIEDTRLIFVGGGNTGYPSLPYAVIHEYDPTNLGIVTDHSTKIPSEWVYDLTVQDVIKKDNNLLIIGNHYTSSGRYANAMYVTDLNFDNWERVDLQVLSQASRFDKFKHFGVDKYGDIYVSKDENLEILKYKTIATHINPDATSATLVNSNLFVSSLTNSLTTELTTYNNKQYLVFNCDDGSTVTGRKGTIIENDFTNNNWTIKYTQDADLYYLNEIDGYLHIGATYYDYSSSYLDDCYRTNDLSNYLHTNSQHYTQAGSYRYGENYKQLKCGSQYFSFGCQYDTANKSVIYLGTAPDSWNVDPNYVWSAAFRFTKEHIVYNNKIYFIQGDRKDRWHDIYEFDPATSTVTQLNLGAKKIACLTIFNGKLLAVGEDLLNTYNNQQCCVLDISNFPTYKEYSGNLGFDINVAGNVTYAKQLNNDLILTACDYNANKNYIIATKDLKLYRKLYEESFDSTIERYLMFNTDNNNKIYITTYLTSGVKIKEFIVNY